MLTSWPLATFLLLLVRRNDPVQHTYRMQDFLELVLEARQAYVAPSVLQNYERAFRDELVHVIQRTQNPTLRGKLEEMLHCPIVDSRGQCRTFTDYILSALIKNGVHHRCDLESALSYIVEKMLMATSDSGQPRDTVFGGFQELPDYASGNPLLARFLKYLKFAVNNVAKGKIPRLASVEQRPQGTISIGQGRQKAGDPYAGISPDEIPARRSTEKDLDEMVWDIKMLLRQKERTLGLPLEELFISMMQGMRSEEQRITFGDRTARMGRQAIIQTIKGYAESSGNITLLNLLKKFEDFQGNQPMQPKRQVAKVAKPVLTEKQRDYASIINVIDRLGRPVGSADLGRYRRRWLEYPARNTALGYRNRLEEVLACMVADGVLKATRTAAGAWTYSPGPQYNRYRGEVGAVAGSPY